MWITKFFSIYQESIKIISRLTRSWIFFKWIQLFYDYTTVFVEYLSMIWATWKIKWHLLNCVYWHYSIVWMQIPFDIEIPNYLSIYPIWFCFVHLNTMTEIFIDCLNFSYSSFVKDLHAIIHLDDDIQLFHLSNSMHKLLRYKFLECYRRKHLCGLKNVFLYTRISFNIQNILYCI